MSLIYLSKKQVTTINNEIFDYFDKWIWSTLNGSNSYYAWRTGPNNEAILLHREIMIYLGYDIEGMYVDHIDRNGLNNYTSNLRVVTPTQSSMNRGLNKNNTSGYKGVWYERRSGKWVAEIIIHGHKYYIGRFDTAYEAALAYDKYARNNFPGIAYLNFPDIIT